MKFYDIHCHLFNIYDMPVETLMKRYGVAISIMVRNFKWLKIDNHVRDFVSNVERNNKSLLLDYVKQLMGAFNELYKKGIIGKPTSYVSTPLTMDYSLESKNKPIISQIENLKEAVISNSEYLNEHNFEIKPFLGISDFNKIQFGLIKEAIDKANGPFCGVKIYPPLNFDVKASADSYVWKYLEDNEIPVTAHCNSGGFVSKHITRRKARKLTHPENWQYVLDKCPNLKLNMSHAGDGKRSWVREIIKLCMNYPNTFSDISYTIGDSKKTLKIFKKFVKNNVSHKVLFGTDFAMCSMQNNSIDGLISDFFEELNYIYPEKIVDLVSNNPERFLR